MANHLTPEDNLQGVRHGPQGGHPHLRSGARAHLPRQDRQDPVRGGARTERVRRRHRSRLAGFQHTSRTRAAALREESVALVRNHFPCTVVACAGAARPTAGARDPRVGRPRRARGRGAGLVRRSDGPPAALPPGLARRAGAHPAARAVRPRRAARARPGRARGGDRAHRRARRRGARPGRPHPGGAPQPRPRARAPARPPPGDLQAPGPPIRSRCCWAPGRSTRL